MIRHTPATLAAKRIDAHAHAGVSLKAYGTQEYPYAQTIEGLYFRQLAGRVDVNVVFPFTPDLHFDQAELMRGRMTPAADPVSAIPYQSENRLLLREIFEFCPEISDRFLPFLSIDPGRMPEEQVRELENLCRAYPVYGIKVNPVLCQSPVEGLLGAGSVLLDFAEEHDLPLLFHATPLPNDEYSQAEVVLRISAARPRLRVCLAHCILFHAQFLEQAHAAGNVWVDTAALKIQVELVRGLLHDHDKGTFLDLDYTSHLAVMKSLCARYPQTMLWGTDAPAYAYICQRNQGTAGTQEFRLKATYDDEVDALEVLAPPVRERIAGSNILAFLFGDIR